MRVPTATPDDPHFRRLPDRPTLGFGQHDARSQAADVWAGMVPAEMKGTTMKIVAVSEMCSCQSPCMEDRAASNQYMAVGMPGNVMDYRVCDLCGLPIQGTQATHVEADSREGNEAKVRLADIETRHVWFSGVGEPAGCDLIAEDGEDLNIPGGPESDWYDLLGIVGQDGRWQWDGEGEPTDFNRNTVTSIVAFVAK